MEFSIKVRCFTAGLGAPVNKTVAYYCRDQCRALFAAGCTLIVLLIVFLVSPLSSQFPVGLLLS